MHLKEEAEYANSHYPSIASRFLSPATVVSVNHVPEVAFEF
jgi:hypothetical protein